MTKEALERKCAKMRQKYQQQKSVPANVPAPVVVFKNEPEAKPDFTEPMYSIREAAEMFHWGYYKAYRYWSKHPGVHVDLNADSTKKVKKSYQIPESVLVAVWKKKATFNERMHPKNKRAA
jgi:hypothetical protein